MNDQGVDWFEWIWLFAAISCTLLAAIVALLISLVVIQNRAHPKPVPPPFPYQVPTQRQPYGDHRG